MIHSKKSQEGELIIDHRFSPGIPNDIIIPGLPVIKAIPEGTLFEAPIATCAHCHTTIILNPNRTRPRNNCYSCNHYICDKPGCNFQCLPIKKVFDTILEENARNLNIGEI